VTLIPLRFWPTPLANFRHLRLFLILLCVFITGLVVAIFAFLYARTSDLLIQRVREQAVAYADLINHTKNWNFNYGGVYVEKRPGVESNAHLLRLGITPDLQAENGRTFTMRNHAMMVSEISRMSERENGIRFRIVSRKPIDPRNHPDTFEEQGLQAFAGGSRELSHVERPGGKPAQFRYLAPLFVEGACLECHQDQGYAVGDVIGAISITIPMPQLIRETEQTRLVLLLAAVLVSGVIVLATYFLTWQLAIRLDRTQRNLERQATTDELTGLRNRRETMRRLAEEFQRADRLGEPLSLLMIDVDHFKLINDRYGHPVGDQVLASVAVRMQEALRSYDILGRVGGEEFMVISPEVDRDEGISLAERLRTVISGAPFQAGNEEILVTISIGIASRSERETETGSLLQRADAALYRAKDEGRDRVVAL
jgi:diguanylate cyclase (GGDEF)-like protein